MKKYTLKAGAALGGVVGSVLLFAAPSFAAADPVLQSQTDSLKTYFSDNIGIVVGVFLGIAALVWLLNMAFRSAGAKRPSKVG